MGVKIQVLMIFVTIMGFASISYAAQGIATFYNPPYVPSACYGYKDHGRLVAAASSSLWKNRAACGKVYHVKCIGATNMATHPCKEATVTVRIVDYCPPGCHGTIDLSKDAFTTIAHPSAGRIKIEYLEVKT